jgi:membrane fusion protein
VLLRYPAYPHQHYGQYQGRILGISRQPVPAVRTGTVDAAAARAQSRYRATVALDRQRVRDDSGIERDLRPGLGVEADIVLEKHRLYEWLLEPFARLRERISA